MISTSDFPAWVVATANAIAQQRGWTPFTAYQGKYNIGERDLEQEVFPMCQNFNIATVPWAVVGGGKFTGTRTRESDGNKGQPKDTARKTVQMTENDFKIQDVILEIAKELNRSPTQVVVNWTLRKTTSPLLGCRTLKQLEDNLGALEFELTPEQVARLDEVGKNCPALIFPHGFYGAALPTNPRDFPFLYLPEKKYSIEL